MRLQPRHAGSFCNSVPENQPNPESENSKPIAAIQTMIHSCPVSPSAFCAMLLCFFLKVETLFQSFREVIRSAFKIGRNAGHHKVRQSSAFITRCGTRFSMAPVTDEFEIAK